MTETNIDELEDFVIWRNSNPDLTLLEYLYHNLSASLAIAVARLFWPELVLHKEGVFMVESFSEHVFDAWNSQLSGDLAGIERAMNHVHLGDIAGSLHTLGLKNQEYLANVISNCWQCRLKQAYPNRNFCIQVGPEANSSDFVITFFQE